MGDWYLHIKRDHKSDFYFSITDSYRQEKRGQVQVPFHRNGSILEATSELPIKHLHLNGREKGSSRVLEL